MKSTRPRRPRRNPRWTVPRSPRKRWSASLTTAWVLARLAERGLRGNWGEVEGEHFLTTRDMFWAIFDQERVTP